MRMYKEDLNFTDLDPINDGRGIHEQDRKVVDTVIDKSIELGNVLKTQKNLTPDLIARSVESLQFSENTVNFAYTEGENMAIERQFADNANDAIIGQWTIGLYRMLVQEIGSSVERESILSISFPDQTVREYEIIVERLQQNSGILPEYGGDSSPIPTVNPLNASDFRYRPGLFAGRVMLNAKTIMFGRRRGQGTLDQRGIGQIIGYNAVNLTVQGYTRKKKMIADMVFNNGWVYAGQIINSNIPSGNYVNLYQPMGVLNSDGSVTYNTTDPTYTPLIAITNIVNNPAFIKYRKYIKAILVNGADLQAIMNHPAVREVTTIMTAGFASLTRDFKININGIAKNLAGFYAPGFDIPIVSDDDVWVGQDTYGNPQNSQQNFFIPRGQMMIIMDFPADMGGLGAFLLTLNELDPNIENPVAGFFMGIFNRNLQNSEISNRLDIVGGFAGGPMVIRPEAIIVLKGLYSNVT